MLLLLTNQKYECQQCQKEHSEGHQILKIKTILHRHHLHSVRMKVTHPLPYGMYTIAGSLPGGMGSYPMEKTYWNENGWMDKKRPWK